MHPAQSSGASIGGGPDTETEVEADISLRCALANALCTQGDCLRAASVLSESPPLQAVLPAPPLCTAAGGALTAASLSASLLQQDAQLTQAHTSAASGASGGSGDALIRPACFHLLTATAHAFLSAIPLALAQAAQQAGPQPTGSPGSPGAHERDILVAIAERYVRRATDVLRDALTKTAARAAGAIGGLGADAAVLREWMRPAALQVAEAALTAASARISEARGRFVEASVRLVDLLGALASATALDPAAGTPTEPLPWYVALPLHQAIAFAPLARSTAGGFVPAPFVSEQDLLLRTAQGAVLSRGRIAILALGSGSAPAAQRQQEQQQKRRCLSFVLSHALFPTLPAPLQALLRSLAAGSSRIPRDAWVAALPPATQPVSFALSGGEVSSLFASAVRSHNLDVLAGSFDSLRMAALARLLDCASVEEAETEAALWIAEKRAVGVVIDQCDMFLDFKPPSLAASAGRMGSEAMSASIRDVGQALNFAADKVNSILAQQS
jgi:hypothetical protein